MPRPGQRQELPVTNKNCCACRDFDEDAHAEVESTANGKRKKKKKKKKRDSQGPLASESQPPEEEGTEDG